MKGTPMTLTSREAFALADAFWAAAMKSADADTVATLFDLTADLINHSNGHPTWLGA